jgi:molecular chaperone DnaK (HSP70)
MSMPKNSPRLGIDFGTTYCSMSWFDASSNQAKILPNFEGELKTPSAVFYGPDGTSVGLAAVNEFMDAVRLGEGRQQEAAGRLIRSIKRNLLRPPVIAVPAGRTVRPREVVALLLGKLKRDAEEGHFHERVGCVTITVPAAFDADQRAVIAEGARLAGFVEEEILEEPVAAAIAFACEGRKVGNSILVYDLGGGTFDLAVLTRTGNGRFALALPPAGDAECGGDDFDEALYDYCNQQYGLGNEGEIDVPFLLECRDAKEKLSTSPKTVILRLIAGQSRSLTVTRECFEGLIRARVARTMRKTSAMLEQARSSGCEVDTIVLVGGSARVPLVNQELKRVLAQSGAKAELLKYANQDVAVALGGSYAGVAPRTPQEKLNHWKASGDGRRASPDIRPSDASEVRESGTRLRIICRSPSLWAFFNFRQIDVRVLLDELQVGFVNLSNGVDLCVRTTAAIHELAVIAQATTWSGATALVGARKYTLDLTPGGRFEAEFSFSQWRLGVGFSAGVTVFRVSSNSDVP